MRQINMANEKQGQKKGAAGDVPEGTVVNLAPEGFVPLNLDRAFYSPQHTKTPLQGYLIASETMHSPALDRDFEAVIIRTTADTECVDGNKNLVPVKAGADVILVITSSLKKLLTLAGRDKIPEINIAHAGKRQIGGGKTLNTYNAFITPAENWPSRSQVASDTLGMADGGEFAQIGGGSSAPQLTS
jgi:hypothetical protein